MVEVCGLVQICNFKFHTKNFSFKFSSSFFLQEEIQKIVLMEMTSLYKYFLTWMKCFIFCSLFFLFRSLVHYIQIVSTFNTSSCAPSTSAKLTNCYHKSHFFSFFNNFVYMSSLKSAMTPVIKKCLFMLSRFEEAFLFVLFMVLCSPWGHVIRSCICL